MRRARHHAVTYPDDAAALTLLDVLINEGSADSFTAILYPDFVPDWTAALSRSELAAVWAQMKADLHATNPTTIDRWVFGNGVSRQAGYTIGFAIMQSWLKRHPGVPPSEWSRLSPQAILEGSGYARLNHDEWDARMGSDPVSTIRGRRARIRFCENRNLDPTPYFGL